MTCSASTTSNIRPADSASSSVQRTAPRRPPRRSLRGWPWHSCLSCQSKWHHIHVPGRGSTEGKYLAHWPEYFIVAEAPGGELMGYIMGKAEGSVAREEWHGHVTALSVAPEFRRLGLAAKLMELLEEISERKGGFFVDLFVRVSNQVAVNMYKQLGYSVYRTVIEYYSASNGEPDEDAYDMRKALSRDTEKKSIIPLPHPVRPEDIE
ncbi:N-alpha-acetyltransferase 20 isoform X1 [Neofelis nebulosa]|uniref:N-alpha-acetyltransferase 20 isoform X1 n=1 Tax=Neofelis nebulosa TaxID=61452 RepID=UPI00272A3B63|nr:N-alpha-acetyltransferase 20 isoform X1 [Neofelis nebulosa]